jgi:hypothetical protein
VNAIAESSKSWIADLQALRKLIKAKKKSTKPKALLYAPSLAKLLDALDMYSTYCENLRDNMATVEQLKRENHKFAEFIEVRYSAVQCSAVSSPS